MIIYGLVDPRSGVLRYVGKTTNASARLADHLAEARVTQGSHRVNWIRSLVKLGLKPEMVELEAVEETQANDAERFWIASLRAAGARLVNSTDGGDGMSSAEASALARQRMSTPHGRSQLESATRRGKSHPRWTGGQPAKTRRSRKGEPRSQAQQESLRRAWEANMR